MDCPNGDIMRTEMRKGSPSVTGGETNWCVVGAGMGKTVVDRLKCGRLARENGVELEWVRRGNGR